MEFEAAPKVRREGHESTRSSRYDREGSTDRPDPRMFRRIHADAEYDRHGSAQRPSFASGAGEKHWTGAEDASGAKGRDDETSVEAPRHCLQQATVST